MAARKTIEERFWIPGFSEMVTDWLTRFPDDMMSFYLGTGRPPQYQKEIAGMLVDADRVCGDHIVLSKLIHGVCYSPPRGSLVRMLSTWNKTLAADYAVGDLQIHSHATNGESRDQKKRNQNDRDARNTKNEHQGQDDNLIAFPKHG